MGLLEVLNSLGTGAVEITTNLLMTIVHAVHRQFEEADQKHDQEIASIKDMISRLEDRTNQNIAGHYDRTKLLLENAEGRLLQETQLLAQAIEKLQTRHPGSVTN